MMTGHEAQGYGGLEPVYPLALHGGTITIHRLQQARLVVSQIIQDCTMQCLITSIQLRLRETPSHVYYE